MLAVWASLPPVRRVVWTAVIEASAILAARTSTGHRPATGGAPRDPAREFPEAGARFGRALLFLTRSRAVSTVSRGTPESGTGTAIHWLLGSSDYSTLVSDYSACSH